VAVIVLARNSGARSKHYWRLWIRAALAVRERILKLLPQHPPGYETTRKDFHSRTQIT
jgi:hypothetical protein